MKNHVTNSLRVSAFIILGLFALHCSQAQAQITGYDTNGATFDIAPKTGAFTKKTEESISQYNLGATTRKGDNFYYVAAPSGSSENALYRVSLKKSVISHIDLDRDDSVRTLFFSDKKLFGVFYNGNLGTGGIYKIAPSTGVTTLVVDFSELNVEPVPGAFSQVGDFYYILVKPEIDSSKRQLLRFKLKANSAALKDVIDASGGSVACNSILQIFNKKQFLCLASAASETQVTVNKVSLSGKATNVATIAELTRIGTGHTVLTADQKTFFAFGYAPGESNNQHMISFNAKGVVKTNISIPGILLGAHFTSEPPVGNVTKKK